VSSVWYLISAHCVLWKSFISNKDKRSETKLFQNKTDRIIFSSLPSAAKYRENVIFGAFKCSSWSMDKNLVSLSIYYTHTRWVCVFMCQHCLCVSFCMCVLKSFALQIEAFCDWVQTESVRLFSYLQCVCVCNRPCWEYVCACMNIYIYTWIYKYIYVYIHIYILDELVCHSQC